MVNWRDIALVAEHKAPVGDDVSGLERVTVAGAKLKQELGTDARLPQAPFIAEASIFSMAVTKSALHLMMWVLRKAHHGAASHAHFAVEQKERLKRGVESVQPGERERALPRELFIFSARSRASARLSGIISKQLV